METNLKSLRTAAGLTQAQLAELSGVSLRAIQSYEQGCRSLRNVTKVVVKALADALKTEPEKLIE